MKLYDELYGKWKKEIENAEIEELPPDFYSKIADYLKRLKEEGRMLDKHTIKARLLKSEVKNVKRMIRELIQLRHEKIVKKLADGEKIPFNVLTTEEKEIYTGSLSFTEARKAFVKNILRGHISRKDEKKHRRIVLRFLKKVPAIVGVDMKTYGPFNAEDVAPLPSENAKILVKRRLAERVEI